MTVKLAGRFAPGSLTAVVGPNGAGKTTTIKMILGLVRPTRGAVLLDGRDPHDPRARRKLGYLPETPCFYDHLTAEELLTYFAGLFGYRDPERRQRVASLLMSALYDNFRDLVQTGAGAGDILLYYATSMPSDLSVVLPLSMLLSLLFATAGINLDNDKSLVASVAKSENWNSSTGLQPARAAPTTSMASL